MGGVWKIVCIAGVWGWIAATIGLILKGFPARGVFAGRAALPWGVAMIVSFALWLLGMANA
ncbi:hypothetical protein LPW11_01505 [Geomonas sp. RF6]|uniref:hypothetical protein n=1 Tax=Geomonas sp. RF6 TaxID=2897342 RepID=UPI001E4484A6|nr:hypothetical protein [Geomonas sp. RF6]UFS70876.1 hypothetical protein LPW11_01505 [Geomonas sp. RF6]